MKALYTYYIIVIFMITMCMIFSVESKTDPWTDPEIQAVFQDGIATINKNTGKHITTSGAPTYTIDSIGAYCYNPYKNIIWYQTMFGGIIGFYTNNTGGMWDFIVNPYYANADQPVLSMSFYPERRACLMTHSNGCIGMITAHHEYEGLGCLTSFTGKPDGPSIFDESTNMYYVGWLVSIGNWQEDILGWYPYNVTIGGFYEFTPRLPYLRVTQYQPGIFIGYVSSLFNSIYLWTVSNNDDNNIITSYSDSQNSLVLWNPSANTTSVLKHLSQDEILIKAGMFVSNTTLYYISSIANKDPCYLNSLDLVTLENSQVQVCNNNMTCAIFLWMDHTLTNTTT